MVKRSTSKVGDGYTNQELMAICGARLIWDNAIVFAGTGLPILSCMLAQKMHAANAKIVYEGGNIDTRNDELPRSVSDPRLMKNAAAALDIRAALGEILQGGYVDIGFIGGAQIDKFGNVNSTVIGNYKHPKVRLPGSGGANDIASLAKNTFIITLHEKRKFHTCDYVTSPGHLTGKDSRTKAGLREGGPKYIITDLCVFDFDEKSKKARIKSLHPGVTKKEVLKNMSWRPLIPWKIPVTKPPTQTELDILRKKVDPKKVYLS
jgi:glutaconate CoA-transferase, subunit B